jgi:hypothetical protein
MPILTKKLGSLRSELRSLEDASYARRLLGGRGRAQIIPDFITKANESILVIDFYLRIVDFFLRLMPPVSLLTT